MIAWTRGGETNLDNLVFLCTRHHWQVHEGKWQLFLNPDGRVEVLRPPLEFAPAARAPAELAAA